MFQFVSIDLLLVASAGANFGPRKLIFTISCFIKV